MNIFTAFNEEYALPSKVMLKSLILNNQVPLTIYVLYSNLKQETIDSIKELKVKNRIVFYFHKIDDTFLDGVSIPKQFSKETYYRLFAHQFFSKNVDRVLWLDGVIINGPLIDFYSQDFEDKSYIAVENNKPFSQFNEEKKKILMMPSYSKYINTGVLLFNFKKIREKQNNDDVFRYIKEKQEILKLADQDVFNGLLYEDILVVDPNRTYNYFARFITKDKKKELYNKLRIVHYCGIEKPWKENYPDIAFDLWWKYALKCGLKYWAIFFRIYPSHIRAKYRKKIKETKIYPILKTIKSKKH